MPVTTIPLSTMVTSITTGSTVSPIMTDSAGLNSVSVVSSPGGAQALKSASNSMLGCDTGTIAPAGKSLGSGLLPSGCLLTNALPSALPATSQTGIPFGLKNTSSLRPLNLLQLPGGSPMFNTQQQQQQQQQLPQFVQQPQQQQLQLSQFVQQPSASSPQQPEEQGSEQVLTAQEQALTAQQAAIINLTGVGGFPQSQAAVSQLGSAENRPEQSLPQQRLQLSSALQQQQQQQQIQQLRFLQHQMAMAAAAAQTAQLHRHRHTGGQPKSKVKRGMPTTPKF